MDSNIHLLFRKYHRRYATLCSRTTVSLLTLNVLICIGQVAAYTTIRATAGSARVYRIIYAVFWVLTIIPGWIADGWVGRYKVISFSVLSLIPAWFLALGYYFTKQFSSSNVLATVLAIITMMIGGVICGGVYANLLPFTLDQMIGASGEELSAAVQWYYWGIYVGELVGDITLCTLSDVHREFMLVAVVSLLLSFMASIAAGAIILLASRWLNTYPQTTNAFTLIWKVLNYARKTKYPRFRSAFTYLDEEQPSRLDFGKEKFGGPFSEEEVEDVRTVFHLLPLTIAVLGAAPLSDTTFPSHFSYNSASNMTQCFINKATVPYHILVFTAVPVYHFLLYPLLHRHIPSMLRRVGIGLVISLLACLINLSIDTAGHVTLNSTACMFSGHNSSQEVNTLLFDFRWLIIPQTVSGLGELLVICSGGEFILAQTPHRMRGLMSGCMFASLGLSEALSAMFHLPFTLIPHDVYPSCGFYYFLGKSLFIFLIIVAFVIYAKRYKLRERDRQINIQAIIEEHYERYFDQEEEYMRERKRINLGYGTFAATK